MQNFCIFHLSRDFAREMMQDFVEFLQRKALKHPTSQEVGWVTLRFGFGNVAVGAVDGVGGSFNIPS